MYNMNFAEPSVTTWALLRQTSTATNKVAETRLSRVRLTPEKLAVLWACRDHPPPLTPAELSRLVFREAQTVAGLLSRMEKEGLVKRIPKRKGRPFTEIKLTPKGEKACGPGVEVMKSIITELTSGLSQEDRETLHRILRALRQNMLNQLHIEPEPQPRGYPPGKPIPVMW